jgi:hypothetical protein
MRKVMTIVLKNIEEKFINVGSRAKPINIFWGLR